MESILRTGDPVSWATNTMSDRYQSKLANCRLEDFTQDQGDRNKAGEWESAVTNDLRELGIHDSSS